MYCGKVAQQKHQHDERIAALLGIYLGSSEGKDGEKGREKDRERESERECVCESVCVRESARLLLTRGQDTYICKSGAVFHQPLKKKTMFRVFESDSGRDHPDPRAAFPFYRR